MRTTLIFYLCLICSASVAAGNQSFLHDPEVQDFVRETARQHGLNQHKLAAFFTHISEQPEVLERMSKPAERTLPWHEYRDIFLTSERIEQGVEFASAHRALLTRAEREYAVPAAIITAIIGVETYYGRYLGRDAALPALATLAFRYPPRAGFFRQELVEFLLLTDEERLDPRTVKGSYAGAMGMPQFISSSYRRYAVDFDRDGKRDLWDSAADVIGSVANYFHRHGWVEGGAIAERLYPDSVHYRKLLRSDLKPWLSASQLAAAGLRPTTYSSGPYALYVLQQPKITELWLTYPNFYVITRYNRSHLYAMAVHHLALALHQAGVR